MAQKAARTGLHLTDGVAFYATEMSNQLAFVARSVIVTIKNAFSVITRLHSNDKRGEWQHLLCCRLGHDSEHVKRDVFLSQREKAVFTPDFFVI